MVLWVMKYDINPDKLEAYGAWAQGAIPRAIGAGNVVEFNGYRPVSGSRDVAVTVSFANLADWQVWYESDALQASLAEMAR